ncbi:MAG: DNA polymerase domain-containing protein, partial [Thermoplasmata archaeon]
MPRGWLLDATSSPGGDSVILWLKEEGGAVRRAAVPYAPPFYVTGPADRLEDLIRELADDPRVGAVRCEPIRASLFDPPDRRHPALAVVPLPHSARRALATRVDALGGYVAFTLYDVDLSAPQLFLIERGLYPFAPVLFSGGEVAAMEPPDTVEYAAPPLTSSELTVEVAGARAGRPPHPDDPIARVRLGPVVLEGSGEADTLEALLRELRRQDPDLLATHGGDAFDLPHLYRRALVHGYSEATFVLGREWTPFALGRRATTFESYGRILHRVPPHLLSGRFHLDVGRGFVEDVGLAGFIDMARISRLGLQTVARQSPGTAFSASELAVAREDGVCIPWKKNLPEEDKTALGLVAADKGGFILTPRVGLEQGIDEFDFASLFPSIMVRHNLSMETLECPCCPESPHVAPGLGYRSCTLRTGIVPRTIAPMVARRLYFKRRARETTGAERERYVDLARAWK